MARNKGNYYIDKDELIQEIKNYKATPDKQMSDKLGNMLINIAKRFADSPNFIGYTFKDDFISESLLRMIKILDKIDLDHPKTNPFSFLTQQCYWTIVATINKSKKYNILKEELTEHCYDILGQNEDLYLRDEE